MADAWFLESKKLRLALVRSAAIEDVRVFDAIEDQAKTALRFGLAAYDPNSNVLDDQKAEVLKQLDRFIANMRGKHRNSGLVNSLHTLRNRLEALFKIKKQLLKSAVGFRELLKRS